MKTLVVIGSGPAGLTAALYAARAGLSPLVLEGPAPGGPLVNTPLIENIPGFPDGIGGFEFIDSLHRQAERFGATFRGAVVTAFALRPGGGASLTLDDGETLSADAAVIATGAAHRPLGVPGEAEMAGHGVSYCATCDGAFFRNKPVAVVGGGDTACEDALFLARMASSVTLVHRREALRASKIQADRVLSNPKIQVRWNRIVESIDSTDGHVSALRLKDTAGGATETLPVAGLFIAIGLVPSSAPFSAVLPTDAQGYLKADGVFSGHPGVFIAGDVADPVYRQAVSAAGSGCRAGMEAIRHLETLA
jgi:thioredoxin reductase (NADPH)